MLVIETFTAFDGILIMPRPELAKPDPAILDDVGVSPIRHVFEIALTVPPLEKLTVRPDGKYRHEVPATALIAVWRLEGSDAEPLTPNAVMLTRLGAADRCQLLGAVQVVCKQTYVTLFEVST
jgi:hypothetical protein